MGKKEAACLYSVRSQGGAVGHRTPMPGTVASRLHGGQAPVKKSLFLRNV